MRLSNSIHRRCMFAIAAFVLFGVCAVAPASIVYPSWWFENVGLSWDQSSLISYLRSGFPDSLTSVNTQYRESRIPFDLWMKYADIIDLLKDTPEANAALRDVALAPLRAALVDDMLVSHALGGSIGQTYESWERLVEMQSAQFQMRCALKLAQQGHSDANGVVVALVENLKPTVLAALPDVNVGGILAGLYSSLCIHLAQEGSSEGLEALISLLPAAHNTYGGGNVVFYLKRIAGPQFPIDHNMPEPEYREAVSRWQTWWTANRGAFQAPASLWEPPAEKAFYTYPPSAHTDRLDRVLAYLGGSTEWHGESDMVSPSHPEAEAWLEHNARRYRKLLRAVADDPDMPYLLRNAATRWYIKSGGARATRWARDYILEWEPQLKSEPVRPGILLEAVRTENHSNPGATAEIARECVEQQCAATPDALQTLFIHGPEYGSTQFIVDRYEHIVKQFPEVRRSAATYFLEHSTPGDEKVFVDILQSADRKAAHLGVEGIRRRRLIETLSPEARETYDLWVRDAEVIMEVIGVIRNREEREKAVLELVRSVSGTDALSARIYAFGYARLTRDGYADLSPEARVCLNALNRCIAAYHAVRLDSSQI